MEIRDYGRRSHQDQKTDLLELFEEKASAARAGPDEASSAED
jgi:hypothetical protein